VIEGYEPDDRGWGMVIGRFRPKPEPKLEDDQPEPENVIDSDDEQKPSA
jgi:hypothetical protein